MYLALRDLRFAKGRFILMGGVVALITLLLVLLSGLTAGLGNQSTSALAGLPADRIVFGAPAGDNPKASFTESEVTRGQLSAWATREGVAHAELLGISQSRFQAIGSAGTPSGTASVAVFGTEGTGLAPAPVAEGTVVVGSSLAEELELQAGSRATVGGIELTVAAVVPDQWYSHTGVVWTTLGDWRKLAHVTGSDAAATVIAVTAADGQTPDVEAADAAAGTVSATREASFQALGSYKSENGSLLLMQAFLYGISALVIVAFLTVWTVQRTRDVAVLKALGGSSGYVLKDAMVQATIVLLAGAAAGGTAGVAGGALAAGAAPFLLTPQTTLLPMAGIVVLGLAGAALAVRSITRVDPLLALGGN
jgi:putative ABC transport system permease protein